MIDSHVLRERAAELAPCPPRGPNDVVRTAARAAEIRIMQRHGRGMQYQQVWNQNVPHGGLDLDDADDDDGNPIGRTAFSFHLVDKAAWLERNAPSLGARATSGPTGPHYTRDTFSAQNDTPFDAKQLMSCSAEGVWLARPKTASDAQFEAADARRRATRARPSTRARIERAQVAAATAPLTLRDLTGGVLDRPQTAPAPLDGTAGGGRAGALVDDSAEARAARTREVRTARRINALTPSLVPFERVPSRGSIAHFHKVERAATRERMKESRSIHSQLTAKRVQEQIQRAGFRPLQRKVAPTETQLGTMPGARPMRAPNATPGMRSYDQSKKSFSLVKYDV